MTGKHSGYCCYYSLSHTMDVAYLVCMTSVRNSNKSVILQTGKYRNILSADVILQHGILLLSLTSLNTSADICIKKK